MHNLCDHVIDTESAIAFTVGHCRASSRLVLVPGLYISFVGSKPNWWFRLWQKLLLGWMWEDTDDGP